MKIDPEAAAFPLLVNRSYDSDYGLTKREYFAALAMQAVISHYSREGHPVTQLYHEIGSEAVILADALIEALNK